MPGRSASLREFNLLPGDLLRPIAAMAGAPGWQRHLAGVDAAAVTSREALAKLPVLRKGDLKDLQAKEPPFGGLATSAPGGAVARVHVARPDLRARGLRRGLVALGARAVRGRLPQGRHRAQHVRLSPDAGRLDHGRRGARARLHRSSPPVPATPSSSWRRSSTSNPSPMSACRTTSRSCSTRPRRPARTPPRSRRRSCRAGRCFPRCGPEYKQRGIDTYQCYATADLGVDRLREPGARGHDRRRGRDRGDRAAGHRRSGAGGRGGRGGGDLVQPRLPDDPAGHRRPVGGAAGGEPVRAHQHAHQGLDGPRRPDHQGQGHVRASRARRRTRQAPRRPRPAAAGGRPRRRAGRHDAEGGGGQCGRGPRRPGSPRRCRRSPS